MLRLSKLTDYGTVLLACMARAPKAVYTAAELATETHLSLPTVSKLLKQLAKGGLLESYRGAQGGYALARPAEEISAMSIIDVLEGPLAVTECSLEYTRCSIEPVCLIGHNWRRISFAIREALQGVTLAQLAAPAGMPLPRFEFEPSTRDEAASPSA